MHTLTFPEVINGTSGLGNLYTALTDDVKLAIVNEIIKCSHKEVVFDSAGKYGAGLALESLGCCLKILKVDPNKVIISNKLGWLRTELKGEEPTFEPGVWKNLKYDAIQKISYDGILECYEQGNELLNGYQAKLVSVHDPDEYVAVATGQRNAEERYQDILGAYTALAELKASGKVQAVGIGSKDWKMIEKVNQDVKLDWVMIANSITVHSHPRLLLDFMKKLESQGTTIINSAVFNGGFLTGLDFYNYKAVSEENDKELYQWRNAFYQICEKFNTRPAAACIAFSRAAPGVKSIALNTTNASRVSLNFEMAVTPAPTALWRALAAEGMIDKDYVEKYL